MPCHPPEDLEDLSQLLHTYNLVTLNTWRRPRPQAKASTFRFGETESQIDFLLVKRCDATTQARRAHPIHGFHVGASRHGGAIHFRLVAMLQLRCPHWIRRPTQQPPRVSLDSLLSALDNPTDPFCLGQIAAVRQAVSRHMADRTGVEGVNQLHTALCFRPAVKSFRHMRLTLERNRGRPLMCRLVFGSFGPNGEPSNRLGKRVCGVGFQPGVPGKTMTGSTESISDDASRDRGPNMCL